MESSLIFKPKIKYMAWSVSFNVISTVFTVWLVSTAIFELLIFWRLSGVWLQNLNFIYSFFSLRNYFIVSFLALFLSTLRMISLYRFAYVQIKRSKIEVVWGLFRQYATAVPFSSIRTVKRYQSFTDRIVGAGRLLIASSGMSYYEINVGFLSINDVNTICDHLENINYIMNMANRE